MGPIEKSVEQNSLVLVSAYVRPISPTRSQAEFADDLVPDGGY
jgi:hypothetical protein